MRNWYVTECSLDANRLVKENTFNIYLTDLKCYCTYCENVFYFTPLNVFTNIVSFHMNTGGNSRRKKFSGPP